MGNEGKMELNYVQGPGILHYSLHRSFVTTVSQLKMCDFSGETFKGFEVL
jgi:hypothetical protein